jgi:hypothetical protein
MVCGVFVAAALFVAWRRCRFAAPRTLAAV